MNFFNVNIFQKIHVTVHSVLSNTIAIHFAIHKIYNNRITNYLQILAELNLLLIRSLNCKKFYPIFPERKKMNRILSAV